METYFEPWYGDEYSLCLDSDGCRHWLTTDGTQIRAIKADQTEALKRRFFAIMAATVESYADQLKNELKIVWGRPVTPQDVERIIADPKLVKLLAD